MANLVNKVDVLSGRIIETTANPLSSNETKLAAESLVKPLWRSVVQVKNDPPIYKQDFGLFSFTPARGATPNEYGIYGIAKIRGNFKNEDVAAREAARIIREVDSVNEIYTIKVGQSFPLTKEIRFTAEFEKVDLSQQVADVEKEKQETESKKQSEDKKIIIDREKQLLSEHKEILNGTYEEDPLDVYIRAQVKRSQLQYTLEITEKKIANEIKPALERARNEVVELELKNPELKKKYLDKYLEARKEAGLETEFNTNSGTQLDFMKYLVEEEC